MLFRSEFLQHVAQGCNEEAAGTTGRIQQRLGFLGVEHFHDQLHHASWGEILATVTTQVDAHQLLISDAFGINVSAGEVVFSQLGNDECQSPVGEGNFFVAPEDVLELALDLGEELLDALADGLAAFILKLLFRAGPEATLPGLALLCT